MTCIWGLLAFLLCAAKGSGACVSDCTGHSDGNYQSCQSSSSYVVCVGEVLYDLPCPRGTDWDDIKKSCHASAACSAEDARCYEMIECGTGALKANIGYFVLKAPSDYTWGDHAFCQAQFKSYVYNSAYVVRAKLWNDTPVSSGSPGLMFNAKDDDSYDFVYFRPHSEINCYQIGFLENRKYAEVESRPCPRGPPVGRTWFDVEIVVKAGEAKVYMNGLLVTTMKPRYPLGGKTGVIVGNGNKNTIYFKSFELEMIN